MEPRGKRLLASLADDLAERDAERCFSVIPKGADVSNGFQAVNMQDLSRAVNCMSWWIESTIGPAQARETLAYMANNDIRYCIFMMACQKTGYQAFLPSTRNSDEAHLHLLKETGCNKLFFSQGREARPLEIQALCPGLQIFQVPSLQTMLSDKSGLRQYPLTATYTDAEDDIMCIIHSSGTTGLPKPVPLTNGFFATIDYLSCIPWPTGRQPTPFFRLGSEDLVLVTTPLFHLMGLLALVFSIFHGTPALLGPDKPLSVHLLIEVMKATRPTAAFYPPSVLEDLSHSDEALECLSGLRHVYYGGGPLAPEIGDRLRKYTQVITAIGASEIGWIPSVVPESPENWSYFEWAPSYGIEMQAIGDDLYEMVIPRNKDSRSLHGIFHTYPHLDIYRTNDLYQRHSTNANLWKFHGRRDDVIVLSNGEKFTPVEMEAIIEGHPLVAKAMVFGQSRFQAGLLVQPASDVAEMSTELFVEEIWPAVQAANRTIAAHGRVMKSKIGLASKVRPFKTTPKGTVMRRAVLVDYEKEIDMIYSAGEDDLTISLPENLDQASITTYTRQIVTHVLGSSDFVDDQDLYTAGLDSLMTMQVSKSLQKGIQQRRPEIKSEDVNPQVIYANPSVEKLSRFIQDLLSGKTQTEIPRQEKIRKLVEKYTADIPARADNPQARSTSLSTAILTGSTGSLGTYLLHKLLSNPSISKVYCLNRSDAESWQKKGFEEKGLALQASDWETRVEFFQASFGEPRFGLSGAKYQEMLQSVDTIIHNAWMVNFNHSVESFEATHIQGMRRFVDFSLDSPRNAQIHFISSVSTVGGWTPDRGSPIPEIPMEDSSVVLAQGYGESKHVAERICLEASSRASVRTSIYRVGQIAGPTTKSGLWNPQEWLPTIIATSKALGKVPEQLGAMAVDWVPVDTLASIMIDIVNKRHTETTPNAVYHLTNPNTVAWSSLIPTIQEVYPVDTVSFTSWVGELSKIQNPTPAEVAEKPALKLLGFYEGLEDSTNMMSVPLGTERAQEASMTMKSLGPISASLMRNWLAQWQF